MSFDWLDLLDLTDPLQSPSRTAWLLNNITIYRDKIGGSQQLLKNTLRDIAGAKFSNSLFSSLWIQADTSIELSKIIGEVNRGVLISDISLPEFLGYNVNMFDKYRVMYKVTGYDRENNAVDITKYFDFSQSYTKGQIIDRIAELTQGLYGAIFQGVDDITILEGWRRPT